MEFSTINKTKVTAAIAITLLMISTFLLVTNISVFAQDTPHGDLPVEGHGSIPLPPGVTPDFEVDTKASLSFRPNPVGVGQTVLVNVWINPALHASRYLSDYQITITNPEGTQEVVTMDSYLADATAWFVWLVDQEGTWTFKFDFPGGYFPAGNYTTSPGSFVGERVFTFEESCYYKPSSTAEQELTVQKDLVLSWPPSELPSDYWTRPIEFQNREWWSIAGNYPWHGPAGGGPNWESLWDELYPNTSKRASDDYDFVPWVQAPNTAHLVWKRQGAISGIAGGDMGNWGVFMTSGNPYILYSGRAYQIVTKPFNGVPQIVWQCYDIRTGEMYWEYPVTVIGFSMFSGPITSAPTAIEYQRGIAEVIGGGPSGWNQAVNLLYIGSGSLIKYDPWSGEVVGNYSIAPLTSSTYYMNGYALGVQDLGAEAAPNRYRLINWTTFGTETTLNARVVSNITWPWSNLGDSIDFEAGIAADTGQNTPAAMGAWYGTWIRAASLKTGQELWDITVAETMYSSSCTVADHGKVAFLSMDGKFLAFDLTNGDLAWKSEQMDYPWDAGGFGAYSIQSAYGMLYRQAYSGVYAFNWDNGKIMWKYEKPTPYQFETPYTGRDGEGVYSFDPFSNSGIIADGKYYVVTCEHSPTEPISRGWGLCCINITTGEEVWSITGPWGCTLTLQDAISVLPGPIADGYLFAAGSDGYMYVFGKGKSETSVTAPDVAVPKGTAMTIKGTVLDLSPGQTGTPCVSADSMITQMEYLHMQIPIGGLKGDAVITGVPVTLSAIDESGNHIEIGTTTTNGYFGTFSHTWIPPEEGKYEIIAAFEGDDSYGSSAASTAVTVGPAPSQGQPETEEPSAEAPAFPTTEVAIIAAIAIVAVVAIAAYWALRRRK
jgi:hypothetical protein